MAQMQRGERWVSEHGMVEPRCAKSAEEEEEEGSNHSTKAKRRALGLSA